MGKSLFGRRCGLPRGRPFQMIAIPVSRRTWIGRGKQQVPIRFLYSVNRPPSNRVFDTGVLVRLHYTPLVHFCQPLCCIWLKKFLLPPQNDAPPLCSCIFIRIDRFRKRIYRGGTGATMPGGLLPGAHPAMWTPRLALCYPVLCAHAPRLSDTERRRSV